MNAVGIVRNPEMGGTKLYAEPQILKSKYHTERTHQSNNELTQEFSYASCSTKAFINRTFNSHAYGSALWDLYGREANMLYNSWSTSIRRMFRLDRRTHRYLIEPISEMEHLKSAIQRRFISFTQKLSNSSKVAVKEMYNKLGKDCRTTTGANHRRIMLECGSGPGVFEPIPENQEWRFNLIKELIAMRDGCLTTNGWTHQEIDETLTYLCTE